MRIGVILDASFPPDPRVENEALSLIHAGHDVYLFSLDFNLRSGVELYKGIQVVRYPASKMLYRLSALAYTFPFYRWQVAPRIQHFIRTYDVEALHVHDMVIARAAFDANRNFGLPVVLDYHENRPEIMRFYKHVTAFSGKLLINLKRWSTWYYKLAAQADRLIVVTEAARHDILMKTGKEAAEVISLPNSVIADEFLDHPDRVDILERMENSFNVLYIGDTSIRRGIDTAIRAVAILKLKIPSVRLWLVGKGSADDELKALAKALRVEDFIEFEGWQNPSTFPSYLRKTAVGLSPLKRNLHHDTTYANKLFQYMVCGKPLVVSDCTAQANLVSDENCGLIFKADEPADLAAQILFLYEHPSEAEAMGERGKRAVLSKWSWQMVVKPLLKIYEKGIKPTEVAH